MNLLVSASPGNLECAKAIEEVTQIRTRLCSDLAKASSIARSGEFAVVIIDEAVLSDDPSYAEEILRNSGLAVPVFVNTALMRAQRITAEVRSALARVEREKRLAFRQAEMSLRNELKGEITGILVAAGLALQSHDMPLFVEEKLRDIEHLANRMRDRFQVIQ